MIPVGRFGRGASRGNAVVPYLHRLGIDKSWTYWWSPIPTAIMPAVAEKLPVEMVVLSYAPGYGELLSRLASLHVPVHRAAAG